MRRSPHFFARLEDVAPDQAVTLVTGAGLNGAHRESAASPRALDPGVVYPLELELHFTSWTFPAGHRIRLAISSAQWPMIWPTPYATTTTLHLGPDTRIDLPVPPPARHPPPAFLPPEPSEASPTAIDDAGAGGATWPGRFTVERDRVAATTRVVWHGETNSRYPWADRHHAESITYTASDSIPAEAAILGETETTFRLPGRELSWRGRFEMTSDKGRFHYRYTRTLLRDGAVIRTRSWTSDIDRDFQ